MRLLIAYNDGKWWVRGIRIVEHDLDNDEKVYRCDMPLANRLDTLDQAVAVVKQILSDDEEERLKTSPILAFQKWLEYYVSVMGKLTQREYSIAYSAFIAAHPGVGPTTKL